MTVVDQFINTCRNCGMYVPPEVSHSCPSSIAAQEQMWRTSYKYEQTREGGQTCPNCWMWVSSGEAHACKTTAVDQEQFTSWLLEEQPLDRIAAALERIAAVLEAK